MIFHQIRRGGCLSYIVGCEESFAAVVIDPEASLLDKYLALTTRDGLRLHYAIDTHTHADHFSGSRVLAQKLGVPVVMHRNSPAPFVDMHVDDGELIVLGKLRLSVMHTPGHTSDSMALDLDAPTHLTEALRTNHSGGKTVAGLIAEAAEKVPFMAMQEVRRRLESPTGGLLLLDVREKDAFEAGHIPTAIHIPRGQLELRVNGTLTNPAQRIVVYCELGIISTLAAATLKQMGFDRVVALDGGFKKWRESGFPLQPDAEVTTRNLA